MPLAAGGDLALLHRFEQRGLRLGRRAVDLVGQHDVGEDRAAARTRSSRPPVARSSCRMSVPVMSVGIRSGVNWMRLNSSDRQSASVLTISVLARPGTPSRRQCPRAKMRDQQLLDHFVLPDDDLGRSASRSAIVGLVHPGQVRRSASSVGFAQCLHRSLASSLAFNVDRRVKICTEAAE